MSNLSRVALALSKNSDIDTMRRGYELIHEIGTLQGYPAFGDGRTREERSVYLLYAVHKLEAISKVILGNRDSPLSVSFSPSPTIQLEIRLFHEAIQMGKKYIQINLKFPSDIPKEVLDPLNAALVDLNQEFTLSLDFVTPRLLECTLEFSHVALLKVNLLDWESADTSVRTLYRSPLLSRLPYFELDFPNDLDPKFKQVPFMVGEIFYRLGVDVCIYLSCALSIVQGSTL